MCRNLPYQRSSVWNGCSKRYTLFVAKASKHSNIVLGKLRDMGAQGFHNSLESFLVQLLWQQKIRLMKLSFLAAMQLAILTLALVVSPDGQHGARRLVPWFTTVHEEHFIPSRMTHSPARARNIVAMHSLMWQVSPCTQARWTYNILNKVAEFGFDGLAKISLPRNAKPPSVKML